jgi:hypothetical protein
MKEKVGLGGFPAENIVTLIGICLQKLEAEKNAEQKNKEAAELIFKDRNKGKGDLFIDLHGLFVQGEILY